MSTSAPLNYFTQAHGPAAAPTMLLGWVFAGIAVTVCVVVAVLLAIAMRRRGGSGGGAALVRGPDHGLRWVAIGTAVSAAILLGMTVYALMVLNQVGNRPPGRAIDVTVTAYDWWWRVEYAGDGGTAAGAPLVTANEMHIPVGVPVRVHLESADVIHAFWVPQLAGKTQAIPGLSNEQWLQADRAGIYLGQCTQFCGVQHAHMGFEVIAESPEKYAAWRAAQSAPQPPAPAPALALASTSASASAPAPASTSTSATSAAQAGGGAIEQGRALFLARCAGCHTVRGSSAAGIHGPDLTHLQSRRRIAAGVLQNTPENLMQWITHAQVYKPGSRMPSMALEPAEAAHLGAYLATLQ